VTSTALLTDHYELTMLQAALRSGAAHRQCVFEVFARRLPEGRRYGVVAGTGRLVEAVRAFRFGAPEIERLRARDVVDSHTLAFLSDYRFSGNISGYAEGECYFPGSPLLVVEGTFAESVLLETVLLSILNHDSAIASAASRMTSAAGGRPCIEMGSRRTHEWAAVAAARAAYIAGFATTSNLEAGRTHGIPTAGTSAHAFTLLHDDERTAFEAQVACMGPGTTLLVDTYDVTAAVDLAVEIAGAGLGAVRLDSGDLLVQAREVRAQLDGLGATGTRIIVTSDLDEHAIAALAAAPVDAYGVGTSLVTGSGAPTAGLVYKLVAREDQSGKLVDVAKQSKDKATVGGRKWALRRLDARGRAEAEVIGTGQMPTATNDRPLLVDLMRQGEIVTDRGQKDRVRDDRAPGERADKRAPDALEAARTRHQQSLDELPARALQLSRGEPVIATIHQNGHREWTPLNDA
jgi:nicotinate phosphoribosyltransferase